MELLRYLSRIDPRELRIFADLLDELSRTMTGRAAGIEAQRAAWEDRPRTMKIYQGLRDAGLSHERAIHAMAVERDQRPDTVRHSVAAFHKRERAALVIQRNILIMRLARAGLSNADIDAELRRRLGVGAHPNTVARIIKRELTRYRATAGL